MDKESNQKSPDIHRRKMDLKSDLNQFVGVDEENKY